MLLLLLNLIKLKEEKVMFVKSEWGSNYEVALMTANLHDGWIETRCENGEVQYRAVWEIPLSSVN